MMFEGSRLPKNDPHLREWAYLAARTLAALAGCVIAVSLRAQFNVPPDTTDLILPVFILLVSSGSFIATFSIKSLRHWIIPAAALGDGLLALSLSNLAEPLFLQSFSIWLIFIMPALLAIAGLVRASLVWSAAQVGGLVIGTALGVIISSGTPMLQVMLADTLVTFAIIAVSAFILVAAYGLETYFGTLRHALATTTAEREREESALMQRNKAIYDLTFAMTSTIQYDKILEAALEAGRLGVRSPERDAQHLVAAVLLFHADDNQLHIVSGRRLSRADNTQVLPGKLGILAQALTDAEPVIGGPAARDPELQYLTGFSNCRSVLCVPLRAGFDNFGLLVYGSDRSNAFSPEGLEVLTSIGLQATIALQNALLYQTLQEEKDRIVEVEEEARKKLARDLHDGPTQSISAIAMRLSYVQKLLTKQPEMVIPELRKIEDIARNTTKEIRHMLFTLRPLVLETQGLAAALQQLAEKIRETHGQAVNIRVGRDAENALDRNQQGVVFYIVEEAINNARKHASASLINVSVVRQGEMFVVQIADNGVGFDMSSVNNNYEQRGSLGMVNMRERAELLEGRLQVESIPGRGTVITVTAPLRSRMPEAVSEQYRGTTRLEIAANERAARVNFPRR